MSDLRPDLIAFVDGELSAEDAARMQAGISEDPELAQEYSDAVAVARVLRTELREAPVTGFVDTLAAIRAGVPLTTEAKSKRPWVQIAQMAMVTAVAGLFIFSAFWNAPAPASDREIASMEKSPGATPMVSSAASSPASQPVATFANPTEHGRFANPALGPVLPPAAGDAGPIVSRAPGSGERPLLALKDPAVDVDGGNASMPSPSRAVADRLPNHLFPLEVEPLPPASGLTSGPGTVAGHLPGVLATSTNLAAMEATVRNLVAQAKGNITGSSRTPEGSRLVVTVDEETLEAVTKNIETVLGANATIEPVSAAVPLAASPKASMAKAAARSATKSDSSDGELTVAQLEKRLADQQSKREELLKDFYEDAKPVKSLELEIQDTKTQLERKKRAAKANPASFIVILRPVKP